MDNEFYKIFKENFPYIVREENTVKEIINSLDNIIITKVDDNYKIIGISIINENTIYMLCVDEKYRNRGIGTELLKESEKTIKSNGYDKVIIGSGNNYLMPGIPTNIKPLKQDLQPEDIYNNVNNKADNFFIKRDYRHSWKDANCFDMRVDLTKENFGKESIGDTINNITYRWATINDISKIRECVDDAHKDFTQYYMNEKCYDENNNQRVLIALDENKVCGTLIVSKETEGKDLGNVGCTAVRHNYRGKHIATNLVVLSTKYLKEQGLSNGFLGYTYTGLEKLYGKAGYKICVYYNMAEKILK